MGKQRWRGLPKPRAVPFQGAWSLRGQRWGLKGALLPQDGSLWKHDPFQESGLHLSPTAAEAKEKARATRINKRAPQMDWNRKREIFSNF